MIITLRGQFLAVTFAYHPKVVAYVKSIPGRAYDARMKCWNVPLDHIDIALNTLLPIGFKLDDQVEKKLNEYTEHRNLLNQILIDPNRYDGQLPLYNFQKIGTMWLRENTGALLADVPGLGKTIQTIEALRCTPGDFLVLCPASLKFSWANEIAKWGGGSAVVVNGSKQQRRELWAASGRWHIANYELLIHDYEYLSARPWSTIICDEATRITNPKAVSVRALKKLTANKRLALTGTPISNSPLDLWGILDWARPGFLGSFYQFRNEYVEFDAWGNVTSYHHLDELAARIAPIVLRRTKEEVLHDFPAKMFEPITFSLSAEERKVYDAVRRQITDEVKELLGGINRSNLNILPVKMLRLKQITDHLSLVGSGATSSKLEVLRDILGPIIASGEKTIVFTQFAQMAKILRAELTAAPVYLIEGSVEPQARQRAVDEFQAGTGAALMIMTEAGAYGLNLQAASYVIHYDAPWSIAKLQQREDRAHRIGQTKSVTVYSLIAKDTIDEYVAKVLHAKQKMSVDLLGDAERLEAAGLSAEDIQAILRI